MWATAFAVIGVAITGIVAIGVCAALIGEGRARYKTRACLQEAIRIVAIVLLEDAHDPAVRKMAKRTKRGVKMSALREAWLSERNETNGGGAA